MNLPSILIAASLAAQAYAHPGYDIRKELAERQAFLKENKNTLDHCASTQKAAGLYERNVKRRAELAGKLAKRVELQRRQTSGTSPVQKPHKSDKTFNAKTPPHEVFGSKKSCVLSPETTEGPFYVIGEHIRDKIVDGEIGIPLHIDIQVVDVNTCEPVKGIFLEMWNANSTGVYSGALAIPNGSGMGDKANLNRKFLRGAQKTDDDGVVQFETVFPGHYSGRATHLHVITHQNAAAKENNTIWDTTLTHIGQAFFDQALIDQVEKTAGYKTNRQAPMKNANDAILLQETQGGADPFFEYVLLGSTLEDGIFGWFSFGINTTYHRPIMPVALNYKEGGQIVTTNPKLAGFAQLFPGGFPTAYQPGMGPSPTNLRLARATAE